MNWGYDQTQIEFRGQLIMVTDIAKLVSDVYGAALHPQRWPSVMAHLRELTHADAAGIVTRNTDGERVVVAASLPAAAFDPYQTYYRTIDYVLDTVEHSPTGLILDGPTLVASKAGSEFDHDWMRVHDLQDGLFVRLNASTTFLLAAPHATTKPYCTNELTTQIHQLVPHLQQAITVQTDYAALQDTAAHLRSQILTSDRGMILLRPDGTIDCMNTEARRILSAGDGLSTRDSRLTASKQSTADDLDHAIAAATTGLPTNIRSSTSLHCQRRSGLRPYTIHATPLGDDVDDQNPGTAAIIAIIDTTRPLPGLAAAMRNLYQLTPTECAVAEQLLNGNGLQAIADEFYLSIDTIKTHVRSIFTKTETHRQAELVRLLLDTAAGSPTPNHTISTDK
ncbi:helix-turn-helix transcriptional regulator [Mycolicibacterium senegalense]|uniref:helix-turn-helix transcriptional regulator n=1 Tax=Mycolicibacterium senegalense TaxID=1796 RepID=UPI003AAA4656